MYSSGNDQIVGRSGSLRACTDKGNAAQPAASRDGQTRTSCGCSRHWKICVTAAMPESVTVPFSTGSVKTKAMALLQCGHTGERGPGVLPPSLQCRLRGLRRTCTDTGTGGGDGTAVVRVAETQALVQRLMEIANVPEDYRSRRHGVHRHESTVME